MPTTTPEQRAAQDAAPHIAEMLASNAAGYLAYCTIAHDGGISLSRYVRQTYSPTAREWNRSSTSGIGSTAWPYGAAFVEAIKAAGILVIDCSTAKFGPLLRETTRGPMLAAHPSEISPQWAGTSLDSVPLAEFVRRRQAVGVTFHNLPPL